MASITCFEDIIAWQKARLLTQLIYKAFGTNRDFGFRDQMQRASVSIMNNIAEGFERQTPKDFAHYLRMAKASCGEVRSMLYLVEDLQYLTAAQKEELHALTIEIARLILGLAASLSHRTSSLGTRN